MNFLEELFPDQLDQRIKKNPILVLPLGTIEWHSYHLPVGLDGIVSQKICEEIARACKAVLAPVFYSAVGGVPYPYTLNLTAEIIEPLYAAMLEQLGMMGFRCIVAFTGHFGLEQTLILKRAALEVMQRGSVTILPLTEYDLVTDLYTGDHAATGETSLLMALRPELVRLNAVPEGEMLDGIIGKDPRGDASPEKGKILVDTIVRRTCEVASRFTRSTSELERKEYLQAVSLIVNILEVLAQERKVRPKSEVPPVATPAYIRACQLIYEGDYQAAQSAAEQKLADLSQ
jgi:creatinine amidohydrolase